MVKVVVWGVPVGVHDGLAHTRASPATAPIENCLKSIGLPEGHYCIFYPEDAEACVGKVIILEMERLPNACLEKRSEAWLLTSALHMIWPRHIIEAYFNGACMAIRGAE